MSDTYKHQLGDIEEVASGLKEDSDALAVVAFHDKKRFIIQVLLFVLVLMAIVFSFVVLDLEHLDPADLRTWVAGFGLLSWAVFLVLNAVFTVLFLPGSFFSFSAGALFGLPIGFVIVLIGETIGGTLAFLLGRYFGGLWRSQVAAATATGPVKTLNHYISRHGMWVVVFLRIVPIIPYTLFNYMMGITKIKSRE